MRAVPAGAEAAFARRLDAANPGPLALALSGGGDSVALLRLATAWCARKGRPLLALTVDHRLHPDSARWTAFAGEAARAAGAEWRSLAWEGPKPAAGLPAAARAARHRLLAEAARRAGAGVLLTGHTADDAIEGELMRGGDAPGLGRLREWTPSPVWPEGRGLFLLRPLLALRRSALRAWLAAQGESWLEDPANEDLRYARARARAALAGSSAPGRAGPDEAGRSELQGGLGPDPALGDRPSPRSEERRPSATGDGRIVLRRRGLDGRTLAAALLCAAGTSRPPRGGALERLRNRCAGGDRVEATLAGARVVADDAWVQIGREAGERFRGGLAPLALTAGEPLVWDGRFEIVADRPGWTAAPLAGAVGRLGREDLRALRAIPAWARGALPALSDASGAVRLPRPFGAGPAAAVSLAAERFAAACGLMARETEIGVSHHGAQDLATLCSCASGTGFAGADLQHAQGRR